MCTCTFIPYKAIFLKIPLQQKKSYFCKVFYFFCCLFKIIL